MKKHAFLFLLFFLFVNCTKELTFEKKTFEKKSSLACIEDCPEISVTIPIAENIPIVADSINKKVLHTIMEIAYFGDKPKEITSVDQVIASFISSYEDIKKKFPDETIGWIAEINGTVDYQTKEIINLKIEHNSYTGGAHGFHGFQSLLFDAKTGKSLKPSDLFADKKSFMALAEKEFRKKYKIQKNKSLNSTGLIFPNAKFELPINIFYTSQGLLLYYNAYEIASYSDGPKELLLPYETLKNYLKYD